MFTQVSLRVIGIMEQYFSDSNTRTNNGKIFPSIDKEISRSDYFQKRCVMFSRLSTSPVCFTRHST